MERTVAVEHVEAVIERLEDDVLPVPVRELWVFGDLVLGLDPIDRLDLYLNKDLLMGGDPEAAEEYAAAYGVKGVGTAVSAAWADAHPEHIEANASGHVAPERCLANHILPADTPVHLEVCNAGFESNVTQRLEAARTRGSFEEVLDPRAVCVWQDGHVAAESLDKLRAGEFVFPTLARSLTMLGLDEETAEDAAAELDRWKADLEGRSVRGEVV